MSQIWLQWICWTCCSLEAMFSHEAPSLAVVPPRRLWTSFGCSLIAPMLRPFKHMCFFVGCFQTDVVGLPHLYLQNLHKCVVMANQKVHQFSHMICLLHLWGDLNVFCFHCSSLNPSSWSRLRMIQGFAPPLEPWCEAFNFFRLLDASTLGALKFQQVDDGGSVGLKPLSLGSDWCYSYLICNYMSGWGGKWDHEPLSGNVV